MEPGQGVTVGLIDSGIDTEHPLFEGKIISETFLHSAVDEQGGKFSHGTAVTSVIVAQPLNIPNGFHGVAWGADLKMFALHLGDSSSQGSPGYTPPVYTPITLEDLSKYDSHDAKLFNGVLEQDIDILNVSRGFNGIIENYSEDDIRDNYGQTIAALAQTGAQEKTILVWAAGNAHGWACTPGSDNCVGQSLDASSVQLWPGLVARIDELKGHSIAVAAVGRNGDIAHFSNRCGIAAQWCIAAPGVDVKVAYFGPSDDLRPEGRGVLFKSGTSYAAPMVSGGLAVMKQLFRDQLSNTALVTRLFATAAKSRQVFRPRNLRPRHDEPRGGDVASRRDRDCPRQHSRQCGSQRPNDQSQTRESIRRRVGAFAGGSGNRGVRQAGGTVLVPAG